MHNKHPGFYLKPEDVFIHCSRRLLIDILHDEMECGEFMTDNLDGTFYPPDSLEQLINIYATQNTSIQHCIVSSPTDVYSNTMTLEPS